MQLDDGVIILKGQYNFGGNRMKFGGCSIFARLICGHSSVVNVTAESVVRTDGIRNKLVSFFAMQLGFQVSRMLCVETPKFRNQLHLLDACM